MAKRKAVGFLMTELGLSERRSCRIVGLARSVQQYRPVPRDDAAVLERMRVLASENRRYGYLRLHAMLRREGLVANRKRTWRLYKAEGLQVRTKKRRKLPRRDRIAPQVPEFGFRLWLRSATYELLEPATLAGHLALGSARPGVEIGLSFLPIGLGRPPTGLRHGGPAVTSLAGWLETIAGAATAGRSRLSALADWRERTAKTIQGMQGRGAPSLADLFLARPVLSASAVAAELGLTGTRSRDLLNAFERRGRVREMTGQGRFRFWQPRL